MRLPSAPPSTSMSPTTSHAVGGAAQHAHQHDRHDHRADREDRRDALEAAERAAAVARQLEADACRRSPTSGRRRARATAQLFVSWSSTTIVSDSPRSPTRSGRCARPAGARPAAFVQRRRSPRALHFTHCTDPRDHLEPGERDAITAGDAEAERVVGHLAQRAVDVVDGLAVRWPTARGRARARRSRCRPRPTPRRTGCRPARARSRADRPRR